MTDEWGGIDEKIQKLVTTLNYAGFQTTGSCEGHINRDAPAPWIKIGSDEIDKDAELREKMIKLLDRFYVSRAVPQDVRLMISDASFGFYLHNGGEFYDKWREEVQTTAAQIKSGHAIKANSLSDERENSRAEKLPLYQKEIEEFAEFLNKEN